MTTTDKTSSRAALLTASTASARCVRTWRKALLASAAVLAIAALDASPASAAAMTWTAGGGNTLWGTTTNWGTTTSPSGNDITFNATGAVSGNSTVTSTLDASYNINSLTVLNTAANYHNFDLNSKTLTVANGISFGYNNAGSATAATNATMKSGTLNMTAGNFLVGGSSGAAEESYAATVDLTNLTTLTVGNSSSTFGVGYYAATASSNTLTYGAGSLTLSGGTNTITASLLAVGYTAASDSQANNAKNGTLTLKGTTDIKATTISIAHAKSSNSSILTSGATAVTLHGPTGGSSPVTTFTIAGLGYSTGFNVTGKADFSGGSLNGAITTLNIAAGGAAEAGTGTAAGTFVTGTSGTLDVTTVQFGHNNVSNANAVLDIRGGTFRFDTWNDGSSPGTRQLLIKAGTFSALNANANTITGLSTLQMGGSGTVTFGQTVTGTGGLNITSDAITLGAASNTVVVNVSTTLSGTISSTTNTMTLNGGTATMQLAGATDNLNTGLVTVTTGELDLNKTATVDAIGGNLTVNGGTVKLLAANQIPDSATVTVSSGSFHTNNLTETVGTFSMSGGALDGTTGTLTATTYGLTGGTVNAKLGPGAITVNTGTVTLGSAGRLNSTSTLSVQGGQLTLAGAESVASYKQTGGTLAGTGLTLTSATAYDMQAGTVNAILGGGVGLNKTTAGTVTLTASNTYTGTTTVSLGTLIANVSGGASGIKSLGTGSVSIAPSATLNLTDVGTSTGNVQPPNTFTGSGTLKLTFNNTTNNSYWYLYGANLNGFAGLIELANSTPSNRTTIYSSGDGSTGIVAPNATLQIDSGSTYQARNTNLFKAVYVSGTGNANTANGGVAIYLHSSASDNFHDTPIYLMDNTTIGSDTTGYIAGNIFSGTNGTQTLTLGTTLQNIGVNLSGAIGGGTGALALTSAYGTNTLSGTNTYTGATQIDNGTLSIPTILANGTAQPLGQGTGAILLGSATAGTLQYTGGAANLGRDITVNGAGGGVVKNSGGAQLTLSGTLTKNGRILTLTGTTGSSILVTGKITGLSANSDLNVDGISVTLTNTNNNYNGPTYVSGGGTLQSGASNVLPNATAVLVGNASTSGTLNLWDYTDTISSLSFGAGGGTVKFSLATGGGSARLTTTGNADLANGTVAFNDTPDGSVGKYILITGGNVVGSSIGGTAPSGYRIFVTGGEVDLVHKATIGTITATPSVPSIITSGTAAFTVTVGNAAPLYSSDLVFSVTSSTNTTGSASGTAAAQGNSGAVSGMIFNGTTVGENQTGYYTVADPNATNSPLVGSVTFNVYGHSSPSLSTTTAAIGDVLRNAVIAAPTTELHNADGYLAGLQVNALGGLTDSGTGLIVPNTYQTLSAAVDTGTSGPYSTVYTIQTSDDTSLPGHIADSNLTYTVSGNVGWATANNGDNPSSYGPALTGHVAGTYNGLESTVKYTTGDGSGYAKVGSTATILLGNATGDPLVSMQWRTQTQAERASTGLLSDVVKLSEITPLDKFVLQMDYDQSLLPLGADESAWAAAGKIFLAKLEGSTWVNAGLLTSYPAPYLGQFDSGDTLGRWGVDTVNNKVWAVVDYNGEFAVVPEPGTVALLGSGLLALLLWRRRKAS